MKVPGSPLKVTIVVAALGGELDPRDVAQPHDLVALGRAAAARRTPPASAASTAW